MKDIDKSLSQFINELASKSPTPGGGGASALAGSLGIALSMMVGNLTIGKSSYSSVEADIDRMLKSADEIKTQMTSLIDEDAIAFEPLARAYGMSKDDPSRLQVMEDALRHACTVPLEIMRLCARAIELCDEFAKKGSRLALSDAGVSAVFCKAALQGASLNVFINTKYMDNRTYAKNIDKEANSILSKYCTMADEIYSNVVSRLQSSSSSPNYI